MTNIILDDTQRRVLESFSKLENTESFPDNWDRDFQREILSMLVKDNYFVIQAVDMIMPEYFVDKVHKDICKIVFDYFRQYLLLPPKHVIVHEINTQITDAKKRSVYLSELKTLCDFYHPGVEGRDYLLDNIFNFAQAQRMKYAFSECLDIMRSKGIRNTQTWDEVKTALREALLFERNFDEGLDYFGTYEERYKQMLDEEDGKERFITGFPSIDSNIKGGGLSYGEIGAVIAPSGVGKSLFLTNVARSNMRRGKKVLYISLEMKQEKIAERMDSILTGIDYSDLYQNRTQVFAKFKEFMESREDKDLLRIKEFPAASADINTIRAYFSQISLRNFRPDLVVVDYIGEMRDYVGIPTHESRGKIVRDLRRFATEEQVCVFTAMQPNRSGKEAAKLGYIDEQHFGDSAAQIRPLDACWSLNQNSIEEDLGLMRCWAVKIRDGKSRFWVFLQRDPRNLQFQEIDKATYGSSMSKHKESKGIKQSKNLGAEEFDMEKFQPTKLQNGVPEV